MNAEIKTQWIQALRSGDYKQTEENLQNQQGYCCLGVLCDLAVKASILPAAEYDAHADVYYYSQEGEVLPHAVAVWSGLPVSPKMILDTEGHIRRVFGGFVTEQTYTPIPITELNDSYRFSFDDIADVLEYQEAS